MSQATPAPTLHPLVGPAGEAASPLAERARHWFSHLETAELSTSENMQERSIATLYALVAGALETIEAIADGDRAPFTSHEDILVEVVAQWLGAWSQTHPFEDYVALRAIRALTNLSADE